MKTTKQTKQKAENLSLFLFGNISTSCKHWVSVGEEQTQRWIKRLEKHYNVIA